MIIASVAMHSVSSLPRIPWSSTLHSVLLNQYTDDWCHYLMRVSILSLLFTYFGSFHHEWCNGVLTVISYTHMRFLPPPVQPNRQLLGPKAFPLDRLMAIFYSILEEDVPPAAHLYSQVRVCALRPLHSGTVLSWKWANIVNYSVATQSGYRGYSGSVYAIIVS